MAGHAQLQFIMTECSEDTNSLDGAQIEFDANDYDVMQIIVFFEELEIGLIVLYGLLIFNIIQSEVMFNLQTY